MKWLAVLGSVLERLAHRALKALAYQLPPRITRKFNGPAGPVGLFVVGCAYGVAYQSQHHSATFPAMSFSPYPFGKKAPTGLVPGFVAGKFPIELKPVGPKS